MQSLAHTTLEPPSPWDVPAPILFNTWKHHAGALRYHIRSASSLGMGSLPALARELVVVGSKLMDLYVGQYTPSEVARFVVDDLVRAGRLEPEVFGKWIASQGGYGMCDLPDGSQWVLRLADEDGRHVHLHPGRWVPQTRRVRANVLRTAVLTLAQVSIQGGDPLDRAVVNHVRQRYLGLAPLGQDLEADQGLGEVIALLR